MNIVITGANGFVGKNLYAELARDTTNIITKITRQSTTEELAAAVGSADFIFHLAGINRPTDEAEFQTGNVDFLKQMLELIKENPKKPTILFSSSIQAERDNAYGISKKQAEETLREFSRTNGNTIYVYQLPNLFGKWCRPNYNSVIATFCYKVARDEEIQVNDPNVQLSLNYIDDIIFEFVRALNGNPTSKNNQLVVPNVYQVTLGQIADTILSFKNDRTNRTLPQLDNAFEKALYSTYLSYLPEDQFSYELTMHKDERGSFTEFLKTPDRGQVSVNISKPGITKGNHWHHTKNEKFLVVSGNGVIRFRKPDEQNIIEYFVSGEKLEVVDIPVGYTHNIENLGDSDMVTVMWVNEIFDPNNPDTYFLEV
ncbi:NAD-dependent epimerase/dehydratase family protein [Macrococcus lamae]|uniref:SDR family oxidoreductase n=1 Tax=Macrococcus lamae TaxID=198484 RepID=A0A4V3BF21_9STAP|nr:NAD-dependent epimerase/dehydratase family protein [Macrococcus lamae]TDM05196.1 SDR family oxidoreductase [Macrococcus lamae]